jgi:hypothetical protein
MHTKNITKNITMLGIIAGACLVLAETPNQTEGEPKKPALESKTLEFVNEIPKEEFKDGEIPWDIGFTDLAQWKTGEPFAGGWDVESKTKDTVKYVNKAPRDFLGGKARTVRIRHDVKTQAIQSIEVIWADLGFSRYNPEMEYLMLYGKDKREQINLTKEYNKQNKEYEKACTLAYKELLETLTTKYGKPSRGKIGDHMKFSVPTLDFDTKTGTTIRLVESHQKMLLAVILPTDEVIARKDKIVKSEIEKLTKAERLETAKKNVGSLPNGDVVIQNVPMHNQGTRPICAYTALAMVTEYWGAPIPIELALVREDTHSTIIDDYWPNINAALEITGVRAQDMKPNFRTIMAEIDEGRPLRIHRQSRHERELLYEDWQVMSEQDPKFVIPVEKDRKERKETWANEDEDPPHHSLITGYNKEQGVVLLTESWGEHARNSRISWEELEYISCKMTTYTPR